MSQDFHAFSNHTITPKPQFDPTFSQFLFCLTDDKWKDTRVRMTPAFSSGRLKSMYANVQAVGQQLVQCIRDNRDQGESMQPAISYAATQQLAGCTSRRSNNRRQRAKRAYLFFRPTIARRKKGGTHVFIGACCS